MIIYKDILTDDELISDSYDLKLIDNVVYEVDCKETTNGEGGFHIDASAFAKEGDEDVDEEAAQQVLDVVSTFHLQSTPLDKKSYMSHFKSYMKKVKAKLAEAGTSEETMKEFESGAQVYAKKIFANFDDYGFYTGESMDLDGMIILLNHRDDGTTPYVTFWKHGLKGQKF